ncbi:MAG: serine--glyoxylate aminotransferase [Candidatus Aeolococcus gillhamiae]|uniref:Tritium exchange subunit n=1 Tax=Candidatus Aeolococcus gillhamiae TaxID=3127015 RepID=A0A2W5Z401_9BACT|nr:MAG: serine--glyoxylate aminotransferase [Candidatus Dormibacter sp. RRmetagenome_bin12]
MTVHPGRHFLQIPGPTNVPDRVLRAISMPTIDHRGPEFAALVMELLDRVRVPFGTEGPVVIFPSSGSGAWEAALVDTLSKGDRVVVFETGHFSALWAAMAAQLGLEVTTIAGDWRHGASPEELAAALAEDTEHLIRAVMVVHSETSTGICSRIPEIRHAIDQARHPAMLFVDAVSSVGAAEYHHDEWGVDVTICGSQKGLMLPPGLGFNAISDKALAAAKTADLPRSYWGWESVLSFNNRGFFPYTPPTNLLYGLREALLMLEEESLPAVFARHLRLAQATRSAVRAWGLEILCQDEREHSPVVTAVLVPDGHDADALRAQILGDFDMSLGAGLGKVAGKVFRIGHVGHFNELSLIGTLGGVEMGLARSPIPYTPGGVAAALDHLADSR